MEDDDREIAYYEKMLGLDKKSGTKNSRKQLKQELETENLLDLFTCVDHILGKGDYLNSSSGEEDEGAEDEEEDGEDQDGEEEYDEDEEEF